VSGRCIPVVFAWVLTVALGNHAVIAGPLFEKYMPYPILKAKHVVQKITNNETNDYDPIISGTNLAWERPGVNHSRSMIFRGGGIQPEKVVSNNFPWLPTADPNPITVNSFRSKTLEGSQLVWLGHTEPTQSSSWGNYGIREALMHFDGSDYNNTAAALLPNNADYQYEWLRSAGNKVVWTASYPDPNPALQKFEIYSYDLAKNQYTQVTQNTSHDVYADVSKNGRIAWTANWDGTEAGLANVDIHMQQGSSTTQLNTSSAGLYPTISDTRAVWFQVNGNQLELVLHDGVSASVIPNTGPVISIRDVAVTEEHVVWRQGTNGANHDIRRFDGTFTNVISLNDVSPNSDSLAASEYRAAWIEDQGSTQSVVFYDGTQSWDVFGGEFSISGIEMSGANMTWEVYQRAPYDMDHEIYAASYYGKWAKLKHAYAVELELTSLDMTGSDTSGADFTGADLSGTRLYEAIMVDAILASAQVEGTDFSNADLTGVLGLDQTVGRAKYSVRTLFPVDFDPVAAGWENLGVVPEPSSVLLFGIGALSLLTLRRRAAVRSGAWVIRTPT